MHVSLTFDVVFSGDKGLFGHCFEGVKCRIFMNNYS